LPHFNYNFYEQGFNFPRLELFGLLHMS